MRRAFGGAQNAIFVAAASPQVTVHVATLPGLRFDVRLHAASTVKELKDAITQSQARHFRLQIFGQ